MSIDHQRRCARLHGRLLVVPFTAYEEHRPIAAALDVVDVCSVGLDGAQTVQAEDAE